MMMPTLQSRSLTIPPDTLRDLHPVLARVYAARVHDARELALTWEALPTPASLADLSKAAERLAQAVVDREPIVVAGDYDADGASASTVLVRALRQFGACVDFLVPDRRLEGYGLTEALARRVAALVPKPRWVVTVDNGIASHAGIAWLQTVGIPVIVTDQSVEVCQYCKYCH